MILWLTLLVQSCLAVMIREPPPPSRISTNEPVEMWLNVRLNHFDASDTDTFPMRFYYNDFSGPHIVIVVGGAWEISPDWVQGGMPVDLATAVGAGVFYTEHRYYGVTRPTNDTNTHELRFLTVDQALGDLAQFIRYIKSDDFENGRHKNGKVVLIGCSYAGSMSTWMKLAYPHLVDGAYSDSGPLHAQEDFPEYFEVLGKALRSQGGESCVSSVEESITALVALLRTDSGPATVSQMFNTCTTITQTPLDEAWFFSSRVIGAFARLVQYALPGDIAEACRALSAETNDKVKRLADWVNEQAPSFPVNTDCVETRYTEAVAAYSNTSYDSAFSEMRLWSYQTCTEFGWYASTSSEKQPFLNTLPLEFYHQICKDWFGNSFDETLLRSGIERTNVFFGGLTHIPDYVVSVFGSHDPLSPMGAAESHATDLSPVYIVPEESHCRAMGSIGETDVEALEATKIEVINQLATYLRGHPVYLSGADNIAASILMMIGVLAAMIH